VEIELIVSDLSQIEKRLERVARDMKKQKTAELEREHALLLRCKAQTEAQRPLREMELTAEEKKLVRGFVFLSQKPILYVLNISESTTLGADVEAAVAKYGLTEAAARPNSGATAICGKVEAELAEMEDEEAAEFLEGYGLTESGLVRLIRKSYELLGLASFFTIGEPETRAWTIPPTAARRKPLERSTPTWRSTSSAPRRSTGTHCWRRAPRRRRGRRERSASKARTTREGWRCVEHSP